MFCFFFFWCCSRSSKTITYFDFTSICCTCLLFVAWNRLSIEDVLILMLELVSRFERWTDQGVDRCLLPVQNQKHHTSQVRSGQVYITCSKDLRPASFPQATISSIINCLTSELLHNTLNVPGIPFSDAQHLITSTSGTTIAIIHDWNKLFTKSFFVYYNCSRLLS